MADFSGKLFKETLVRNITANEEKGLGIEMLNQRGDETYSKTRHVHFEDQINLNSEEDEEEDYSSAEESIYD